MPPFWTARICPRRVALAPRELTESLTADHTDGTDEVVEAAVSAAIPLGQPRQPARTWNVISVLARRRPWGE